MKGSEGHTLYSPLGPHSIKTDTSDRATKWVARGRGWRIGDDGCAGMMLFEIRRIE